MNLDREYEHLRRKVDLMCSLENDDDENNNYSKSKPDGFSEERQQRRHRKSSTLSSHDSGIGVEECQILQSFRAKPASAKTNNKNDRNLKNLSRSCHALTREAIDNDVITSMDRFHSRPNVALLSSQDDNVMTMMNHGKYYNSFTTPVSMETIRRNRKTAAKLLPRLTPTSSSTFFPTSQQSSKATVATFSDSNSSATFAARQELMSVPTTPDYYSPTVSSNSSFSSSDTSGSLGAEAAKIRHLKARSKRRANIISLMMDQVEEEDQHRTFEEIIGLSPFDGRKFAGSKKLNDDASFLRQEHFLKATRLDFGAEVQGLTTAKVTNQKEAMMAQSPSRKLFDSNTIQNNNSDSSWDEPEGQSMKQYNTEEPMVLNNNNYSSVPPPLPKKPPPLPPKNQTTKTPVADVSSSTRQNNVSSTNYCGYCSTPTGNTTAFDLAAAAASVQHHRRPVVPVHPYNGQSDAQSSLNVQVYNPHDSSLDLKNKPAHLIQNAGVKKSIVSPKPPVPPKPSRVAKKFVSIDDQVDSTMINFSSSDVMIRSVKPNSISPRATLLHNAEDDYQVARRSRLIADRSGDTGLSDILRTQHRSGVELISAVFDRVALSSSPVVVVDNESDAKKVAVKSDPRRLSIRSDRSVNLEDEKRELIKSLSEKLTVLDQALKDVQEETRFNDQLGAQVWRAVSQCCQLSENDRELYALQVEDQEKITQLLLKLSGQLAKIENELATSSVKDCADVQVKLSERRKRLADQLKDATNLKQDLDARSASIKEMLAKCLNSDCVDDFVYFMQMRSQLLLDAKELQDKIRLGNDQKNALIESLQ